MSVNFARYSKAILGAVSGGLVGGLTAAGQALTDGHVSSQEGVNIALAFVIGLGFTSATVGFGPANADHRDDDVRDVPPADEDDTQVEPV